MFESENSDENQPLSPPTLESDRPDLIKFIGALLQEEIDSRCRRQFSRHALRMTLAVQPLTADFLPAGETISALSSDLSLKGMSFVHPQALSSEFVRVSFTQFDVSVIARVRHISSIGVDYPLFLVGVEFLDEYYLD